MQIPLFSPYQEVKRRYHELAVLYHPDKNPKNKDAEEYFKIVTQGYNILNDSDKKTEYDALLKNYYELRPAFRVAESEKRRDIREKIFQNRERKRNDIIADYLEAENILSHKNRLLIAALISISGFLMSYNHWFSNYLKFDILYTFAGFLITYFGVYLITNNYYRRDAYRNAIRIENSNVEKRAIRIFMSLFFLIPFIFWGMITTSAFVQLKWFANYTTIQSISLQNGSVYYEYSVSNERILRITYQKIDENYKDYKRVRVKYSRINPNISELVLLED